MRPEQLASVDEEPAWTGKPDARAFERNFCVMFLSPKVTAHSRVRHFVEIGGELPAHVTNPRRALENSRSNVAQ